MTVALEPMSFDQFEQWKRQLIVEYAKDKVQAGVWTEDEALEASETNMAELLPDGMDTEGHDVFVGVASGEVVGQAWLFTDPQTSVCETFIYDIAIDEEHRGKGLGHGLLEAVEAWCTQRDVTAIRLNVFSFNTTAISLYESHGFTPTNLNMMKRIDTS